MKFHLFNILSFLCISQAIDISYTIPSQVAVQSLISIANVKKFLPKEEKIQDIKTKPNKVFISSIHNFYGYTFHNKYQISFDMIRKQLQINMKNKYMNNKILFFRKNLEMIQINVHSSTKLPIPSFLYQKIVNQKMKHILKQL